jgi:hypothetical protein
MAGSFSQGPGTDGDEDCLGQLDQYYTSTTYAELEHMPVTSRRLQFTMITYKWRVLRLPAFFAGRKQQLHEELFWNMADFEPS